MENSKAIVSKSGEGQKLTAYGVEIFFKAKTKDTNGLWSMIEYHLPPSPVGPPPHFHKKTQEIFYVLEGELEFILDGETIQAKTGTLVMIPVNAIHTFKNVSDKNARFQIWFSPGGFEQYFLDMEEIVKNEPTWPPTDMSKVFSLMAKHDMFLPEG